MDNSNKGVATLGDVENQQCNPKWFVERKYMLRPNHKGEVNKLGYVILKVPKYCRQPSIAFSPQAWQFGLHNRENLDNNGSEAIKLGIAMQYGLVGEKWDDFCDAIVDDPKALMACYGLQDGVTSWTNQQIKYVLALDALFLATYIDKKFPSHRRRLWKCNRVPFEFNANDVFYAKYEMWVPVVSCDLGRVENQIPLVLIDKVVKYIDNSILPSTSKGNESFDGDLQYQQKSLEYVMEGLGDSFLDTSSEAFKIDNSYLLNGKTHILGATYKTICGSKGLLMKGVKNVYIHIPSALKLKQSGIKIVGVDKPLYTMFYKKKCLCLPKMRIYDDTISFIRNMAWYECNDISRGCLFNDYISLMTDLIRCYEDLDLLIKNGVIYNTCGIKGFEMWMALEQGITEVNSSKKHHDMKVAIVSRCNLRRYRLWSEFQFIFCSRPWLVLSTIAIVLVTMATLVQTYIAIISSNKMKPKFP